MAHLAHHLGRALLARSAIEASSARALSRAYAYALCSRRSYAATARATKPAASAKKAVKASASEKTPPKKAAPATKKTAKKPAAKTPKKKATKKPAAKKAAPRRTKKKALTPEEKEKLKIRELRAKALKEPVSQRDVSAYNVFVAELIAGKVGDSGAQTNRITQATNEFKNLTPAQLEHYNHLARERNATRKAEFEKWLHSYTPEQIRIANNARAQLRKRLANKQKGNPAYTAKIQDDRQPKAPLNPYAVFFRAKYQTGDMKGIPVTEAAKLIASEWRALSDSEKKKYQDEAEATKPQTKAA